VTAEEIQPNINKNELVKLLGGEDYKNLSYSIRKKLTMWNEQLDNFLRPRLLYSLYKIKSSRNALVLENNIVLKSTKLSKVFRGCSNLVCFLVTIGNVIEEEINSHTSQKRSSDAYILDAMGSVLVEDMAAQFHRRMRKKFQKEDKAVTIRLSPGYCDWLLEEQKKIFSLLDADKVGIELTDSYLMKPRKSISGIFGIMPSTYRQNHPPYNPCSECEKIDCAARRGVALEQKRELLSAG
jgi:hypothetical protein